MKRLYILIGFFVFLFIIFAASFLYKPFKQEIGITPIPIETITVPGNSLEVVATDPKDGAVDVSPDKKITLVFNRDFNEDEIEIALAPETEYKTGISGKILTVAPSGWHAGMPYRYTVKYPTLGVLPQSFTFTVIGPTPDILPDTGPSVEDIKKDEAEEREKHPDIFVANRTPHQDASFSITSNYTEISGPHFYFTVTTKGGDIAAFKEALINWLHTLNLTDAQITTLDIRYQ